MRKPRRNPSRFKRRLPFYHELIEDDRSGGGGGGSRGGGVGRAGASRSRRPHGPARSWLGPHAASTALSRATGHNAVVVKVLSSDIVHKSDVGGVVVNVRDEVGVKTAVSSMSHLSNQFLIEQMAAKPIVEMILGLTRDPQFGLALVIGAGGILVELFQDSQTLLLPTSRAEVASALSKLKITPLLNGYRGQAGVDKEGLITAVLNLARFAEAYADRLIEVDVNPLFVYEGGLTAVDAVVRLQ